MVPPARHGFLPQIAARQLLEVAVPDENARVRPPPLPVAGETFV
jgi:hypothetical protein